MAGPPAPARNQVGNVEDAAAQDGLLPLASQTVASPPVSQPFTSPTGPPWRRATERALTVIPCPKRCPCRASYFLAGPVACGTERIGA